jgi:mutator protein MutT
MVTPKDIEQRLAKMAKSSSERALETAEVSAQPFSSNFSPELLAQLAVRRGELEKELLQAQPDTGPTPAIMASKRPNPETPTTFASLETRELPVVREYSAGGLVFNDQNEIAIIARYSRSGHLEWCLPKGHIEKGETPEQTAVREIHEETGILGEVVNSIATIDYWFTGDEQRIHKLVHHYVLRRISGDLSVDEDPDHEAEEAVWVRFQDLQNTLSYPNERRIVWLFTRKFGSTL